MNYKVVNLRKLNGIWHATLEYWEGCYCSKQSTEVSLEQETRPNLNEIKKEAGL